jgi:hypothetical protein
MEHLQFLKKFVTPVDIGDIVEAGSFGTDLSFIDGEHQSMTKVFW